MSEDTDQGATADIAGPNQRFVIQRDELDQLEKLRTALHDVMSGLRDDSYLKYELQNATATIWGITHLKREQVV